MLLRHTTGEVVERKALSVNPAKTCQPIGAMYAALGIHGCLPHSHGSQGCCSYHRSTLTRHFKEPVMAATSSFTEGSSVFGGLANLTAALELIFKIYDPQVVAIHTTCLSETIGDDIPSIIGKSRSEGKIPADRYVIHCNTPSYVGSHVTGFSNMTKGMVHYFAESTGTKINQVNVIPGWVEPSDMREIKRLTSTMGIKTVMFPDTSDVLDAPQTGKFEMYPKGGATVEEIRSSGDSIATLALGHFASTAAAEELDSKCKVPCHLMELPIGLAATDRFIDTLRSVSGVQVPDSIKRERGQLIDLIADMQQYFYRRKVALFGDPDQLIAMTEFLVTLDMIPRFIVTGTPGKRFEKRISEILEPQGIKAEIRHGAGADMFLLHQWLKNEKVDLLIGNTYGKYIARDEDVPFMRFGFPILDRVGHSYLPSVGYMGGIRLVEKMLNLFLDRKDRDSLEENFELVL